MRHDLPVAASIRPGVQAAAFAAKGAFAWSQTRPNFSANSNREGRLAGDALMKGVVIREPGGPEVLELRDLAEPVPSRGEVRVKVAATAVNRADLLQRMGMYPP